MCSFLSSAKELENILEFHYDSDTIKKYVIERGMLDIDDKHVDDTFTFSF